MKLMLGDCLETLKTLPENSVDSVVTDPPYGLSFMGKRWDYDVPSVEVWREVLRVLKPGGHLLAFGGTRTYHRLAVNVEDAGFEIRDQIQWIYGSGFPKSMDISKAIDKQAGAEREVIGISSKTGSRKSAFAEQRADTDSGFYGEAKTNFATAPATPEAQAWSGWGTALKPANEPIVMARKPLEAKLTVAANVLKHGTGGLNIDASRIGLGETEDQSKLSKRSGKGGSGLYEGSFGQNGGWDCTQGRWPANVLFDDEAAAVLDEQTGDLGPGPKNPAPGNMGLYKSGIKETFGVGYGDSGGASRFFYVAKASKRERNAGLEGMPAKEKEGARPNSKDMSGKFPDHDHRPSGGNNHPTVKPIKLMQYLVRMITPPGGVCLDPFMGSGSTGCAAISLGFDFIGCELSPEYLAIAEKRIAHHQIMEEQTA